MKNQKSLGLLILVIIQVFLLSSLTMAASGKLGSAETNLVVRVTSYSYGGPEGEYGLTAIDADSNQ